jgi:hypothetical protein
MKYDDAAWHYGGKFPPGLPPEAGSTHIGMFIAWCWLNGLGADEIGEEFPEALEMVRKRERSPGEIFRLICEEKFSDDDLNDRGNAFARFYYGVDDSVFGQPGSYLHDYCSLFFVPGYSPYHTPDTWESFDTLAPVIAGRYAQWNARQPGAGA